MAVVEGAGAKSRRLIFRRMTAWIEATIMAARQAGWRAVSYPGPRRKKIALEAFARRTTLPYSATSGADLLDSRPDQECSSSYWEVPMQPREAVLGAIHVLALLPAIPFFGHAQQPEMIRADHHAR